MSTSDPSDPTYQQHRGQIIVTRPAVYGEFVNDLHFTEGAVYVLLRIDEEPCRPLSRMRTLIGTALRRSTDSQRMPQLISPTVSRSMREGGAGDS